MGDRLGNLGFGVRGVDRTTESILDLGQDLRKKSKKAAKGIKEKSIEGLMDI